MLVNINTATRWHCSHATICLDILSKTGKAKAVASRNSCFLCCTGGIFAAFTFYMSVTSKSESDLTLSCAQNPNPLCLQVTWVRPWSEKALQYFALHIHTYSHNLPVSFIFERYHQGPLLKRISISARLLLNWTTPFSFKINNCRQTDVLGPNKTKKLIRRQL